MADPPDTSPSEPDASAYSQAADLAEGLVAAVSATRPDWCQIARDARVLAEAAQQWCPELRG